MCRAVLHGMEYNETKQLPRGEPIYGVGHEGGEFAFLLKHAKHDLIAEVNTGSTISTPLNQSDSRSISENTSAFEEKMHELEQEGVKTQISLLTGKLLHLKEAILLETDPERQFIYQTRIDEYEKKLQNLKGKLQ